MSADRRGAAAGPRLGYVLPGPVVRDGQEVGLEARGHSGLSELAKRWPGELVVLTPGIRDLSHHAAHGYTLSSPDELGFTIVEAPPEPGAIDALGLDLTLGLLAPHWKGITAAVTPAVLTAEVDYGIRLGIHRATASGFRLARAAAGLVRVEAGLRKQARRARSLQCNGPAAWGAYGGLTTAPLQFMDHRVRSDDVARARVSSPWAGDRPLRMAFSGRLDPIKGPEYALEVAHRARRAGLPVEMAFLGAGPMRETLQERAEGWVQFRGFLDYRTEWLNVVRDTVDLMLLPHLQGDPSCTYFESLGSGAPVLGFANATLSPLVRRHGVGWAVPRGDIDGMVEILRSLIDDPEALLRARQAGLDLVAANDFETTTQRRADHLLQHIGPTPL
ncbi:glycosyltransferase [Micrococcus luteus]|uniref:glycosyltransferase n=1 Tax=Micrococcus luteus TaxID=1270 RepID=UPI001CA75843|nr:glycosyltransferase [Micrococcus luteus]QZY84556.1 glycosyltransferase [Micrococcus luteus]